jgi:uncharacterized protein involved in oxidation of intracellular sulfur
VPSDGAAGRRAKIMKTLFIFNDAPYGNERTYNGARLAGSLSKASGVEVRLFLMGDAAACAKDHQKVPEGFYNLQLMLSRIVRDGGQVGVCGTCMGARGIAETELFEGARKSTLAELTSWTQWADKVIVF